LSETVALLLAVALLALLAEAVASGWVVRFDLDDIALRRYGRLDQRF
tara:strand:- start:515 stop:655 length:141 start_codon:yes stop_codon:yes gene_type:complete